MEMNSPNTQNSIKNDSEEFSKLFKQQVQLFISNKSAKNIPHQKADDNYVYMESSQTNIPIKIHFQIRIFQNLSVYFFTGVNPHKIDGGNIEIISEINKINKGSNQYLDKKYYYKESSKQICCRLLFRKQTFREHLYSFKATRFFYETLLQTQGEFIGLVRKLQQKWKNFKKIFLQIKERLKTLEQHFAELISSRPKSSLNLSKKFEVSTTSLNLQVKDVIQQPDNALKYSLCQIQHIYKKQYQQFNSTDQHRVLRKIDIIWRRQDTDWKIPLSSNGKIIKWDMKYYISSQSIHNQARQLIQSQQQSCLNNIAEQKYKEQEVQLSEGYIIQKTIRNKKKNAAASFRNQQAILRYLRNQNQKTIASFFIQKNVIQVKNIYSYYYPTNVNQYEFTPKNFFNFAKYFAHSIDFLQNFKVLHRDLKPDNIMLSDNCLPKIIDFGSGIINQNCMLSKQINKKLLTNGYNLVSKSTSLRYMEDDEYDQHQNFDLYAFGKILSAISSKKIKQDLKVQVITHLSWLINFTTAQNPENRLTGNQVCLYTTVLMKLWEASKEIM